MGRKKKKKEPEPAPAPPPKKKSDDDDDGEESEEDLLGDNEWAKTSEADFSNAVDDMFGDILAMKAQFEEETPEHLRDVKMAKLGDDTAAAEVRAVIRAHTVRSLSLLACLPPDCGAGGGGGKGGGRRRCAEEGS